MGTLLHCCWECKSLQPNGKQYGVSFKNQTKEFAYDPENPLLCIYPEKDTIQKETCTPMFTAALFTIAKT